MSALKYWNGTAWVYAAGVGPTGPQGATGATGPTGPTGATGPAASLSYAYNGTNGDVVCAASTNYALTGSSLAAGIWLVVAQAVFIPNVAGGYTFWLGKTQASATNVLTPFEISAISAQIGTAIGISFATLASNPGGNFVVWLNHYGPGCTVKWTTGNYALAGMTGINSVKIQ